MNMISSKRDQIVNNMQFLCRSGRDNPINHRPPPPPRATHTVGKMGHGPQAPLCVRKSRPSAWKTLSAVFLLAPIQEEPVSDSF